jgi:cytoskeleton protein RodZ
MTAVVSSVETSVSDLAGIGRVLQQGRIEQGMTKENVAQELHLHIRQISAFENGDFSGFSSHAFVKGYLRSCAKLYGLNGDNLVNLYASLQPLQPKTYMPAAAIGSQKIILASKSSNKTALLLLLSIFLIAGIACAFWLGLHSRSMMSPNKVAVVAEQAPDKVEGVVEPIVGIGAASSEIPGTLAVADVAVAPPSENQPIMTPNQDVQDSVLHVEFLDDCWVQLKSDDGAILHDKTYKKGEVLDMSVKAPLHVWFGRAVAVNVSYNGAVVEVPIKPGFQSAQFVLGDEPPSRETE